MKHTPAGLNIIAMEAASSFEEKDPQRKILSLAPMAVDVIERVLDNPKAPLNAQIQVIDMILNRTYGKPEGVLKLEAEERTPEESGVSFQALVERIKMKKGALNHE